MAGQLAIKFGDNEHQLVAAVDKVAWPRCLND
jgi:hypothetical protein